MPRNLSSEHCLTDEFAALVSHARARRDTESRQDLFRALLSLERRAGLAGVSDPLLLRIAEARFLIGLLRDAVVPVCHVTPRETRRLMSAAGEHDLDALGAA